MEYLGRTSRWLCCQAKYSHEPHGVHFEQPLPNHTLQHFLWKYIKNDGSVLSLSVKGTGPSCSLFESIYLRGYETGSLILWSFKAGQVMFRSGNISMLHYIYCACTESSSQDKKISGFYIQFNVKRLWENCFFILQNILKCKRLITNKVNPLTK